MANVTIRKTGNLDEWAKKILQKIEEVADTAVTETVAESSALMKEYISTRGTNKLWRTYYEGRSGNIRNHSGVGRIDSGNMINSVNWNVDVGRKSAYSGEFGWINGDPENYFLKQEKGFKNMLSGTFVAPMNALRDSFTNATTVVKKKISEGLKNI